MARQRIPLLVLLPALALVIITTFLIVPQNGRESAHRSPHVTDGLPVSPRLGVFLGTEPGTLAQFQHWLGARPAYIGDFTPSSSWSKMTDLTSDPDRLAAWSGKGYRLVYALPMLPDELVRGVAQTTTMASARKGADGQFDHFYADIAHQLVDLKFPDAIIRLGWEFNLRGGHLVTDDEDVFVRYWRHIVTAMRKVPGQRFKFDWNVSNSGGHLDASTFFPGVEWVDYVGVDAYDQSWAPGTYPFPHPCDANCKLRHQKAAWHDVYAGDHGLAYWAKFSRTQGLPLSIPEWGVWNRTDVNTPPNRHHAGEDDPYYIQQMKAFIDDPQNNVAYQILFNQDRTLTDGLHALGPNFPASTEEYRRLFGH